MPTYQRMPAATDGRSKKTGVLVVNLGTPEAPTTPAVRRFLRQFLSDPRVVEIPRIPWWLILNLVILLIRPARSAKAYRKIWSEQGSPLLVYSQKLVDRLRENADDRYRIELAMTYGSPSVSDAVDRLLEQGVRRVLVLPLYPQYSGTTTGAVFDAVAAKLQRLRQVPQLRFIDSYHVDDRYVGALANSVREFRQEHGSGQTLLMSFHGVPKSTIDEGDPYFDQCQSTARRLARHLGLTDDEWVLSFQSRVGRAEWLRPYTDESIDRLGRNGGDIDVICPGFAADCLETLEEIAMENAERFVAAGGNRLRYIPALNARADHVDALAALIERQLAGWDASPAEDTATQIAGTGT